MQKFMFGAIGVLALALAFHLGGAVSVAQPGARRSSRAPRCFDVSNVSLSTGAVGLITPSGTVQIWAIGGGRGLKFETTLPKPGVVIRTFALPNAIRVLYDDGDVYNYNTTALEWEMLVDVCPDVPDVKSQFR